MSVYGCLMKLSFARNRLNALLRTQAFGAVGSLVSSLRTFVIAGLVRVVQSRQHLNTIGCNRAMFTIRISI